MDARKALDNISGLVNDYASFAEGFDHVDHGDDDDVREAGEEFPECRFDGYEDAESFATLKALVSAATETLTAFAEYGSEGYYDADEYERMDRERKLALEKLREVLTGNVW